MEFADTQPTHLSRVILNLCKGVVFRDRHSILWQELLPQVAAINKFLQVLNLQVIIDNEEGYAYLQQLPTSEDGEETLPSLIQNRSLSYPVSLLCVLLRKHLIVSEVEEGQSRVVIARHEIQEMLKIFLGEKKSEAKIIDRINQYITKVVDLGFLRPMKQNYEHSGSDNSGKRTGRSDDKFEIIRVIKAFVDANWLKDLQHTLESYKTYGEEHV